MSNVKGILQRLLEARIDFVLVGGLAATMYGASTVTYDVDVCLRFSEENMKSLLRALHDVNPKIRSQTAWTALEALPIDQLCRAENLYLQTNLGGLDLLGSLREIGNFEEVKKHSHEIEILGYPCRVLTIDSLIRIKESIGRPKDRQVALELKSILEKTKNPS